MLSFSGRKFKEVFELYNVDKVLYFEEMFLGMDVDGDGSSNQMNVAWNVGFPRSVGARMERSCLVVRPSMAETLWPWYYRYQVRYYNLSIYRSIIQTLIIESIIIKVIFKLRV